MSWATLPKFDFYTSECFKKKFCYEIRNFKCMLSLKNKQLINVFVTNKNNMKSYFKKHYLFFKLWVSYIKLIAWYIYTRITTTNYIIYLSHLGMPHNIIRNNQNTLKRSLYYIRQWRFKLYFPWLIFNIFTPPTLKKMSLLSNRILMVK